MVKIVKSLRALQWSDLWVAQHERASDFWLSSWQHGESAVPLLVVRLLLAMLSVAILCWSLAEAPVIHWVLYLTHWGLLLVTITTISGFMVSVMAANGSIAGESKDLPWYVSMYWLLYNVSLPLAIVITLLYWVLLFEPEYADPSESLFWLEMMTHTTNTIIVLIEFASVRTPTYLLHVYQPVSVGLWYTIFTIIYYFAGGTDKMGNPFIYDILNWGDHPWVATAVTSVSVIAVFLVHFLLWAIALGRDALSTSLVRGKSIDLPYTPPDDIV